MCADGSAGINFEHTGVDGHTVLRFVVGPFPSGLLFTPFLRFAADIFTEGLMLLARSINPSAPTLFHAPLSPHARAYKPPKGGASKSYIPFVHHVTVTDNTSSSLFSVSKKTNEQNRHHESKPSIPLPKN